MWSAITELFGSNGSICNIFDPIAEVQEMATE
jgi:hypothetical protein